MNRFFYFIFLLIPFSARADLGQIFLFKAKIVLKNGENFVGYYEANDYNNTAIPREYSNDKGFQELLIKESRHTQNKVTMVKDFYVEPKTNFAFVSENDIVNLRLDDIKYTIFYTVFSPNYFGKRLNIVPGSVFSIIENRKEVHFIHYQKGDSDAYVFSINPTYTWNEITKMTRGVCEYLINKESNQTNGYSSKTIKKMEAMKIELEKQNIFFIINYYSGC